MNANLSYITINFRNDSSFENDCTGIFFFFFFFCTGIMSENIAMCKSRLSVLSFA